MCLKDERVSEGEEWISVSSFCCPFFCILGGEGNKGRIKGRETKKTTDANLRSSVSTRSGTAVGTAVGSAGPAGTSYE